MGPFAYLLIFMLSFLLTLGNAAFSSSGSTVFVNDIAYFIPPDVVGRLPGSSSDLPSKFNSLGPVPITVVTIPETGFQVSDLSALVANFPSSDDVFQDGFLEALYIQYTGYGTPSPTDICSQNITKAVVTSKASETIPSGPYFVTSGGTLHRAYRLYSDFAGAFSETCISNSEGVFSALPAGIVGQSLAVAVPSRLYFTKTAGKPLAGVRFGIKDIYDIAGLKTGNGNRAWYKLYPPANKTAVAVQNLIDAGAVVVGKMITSQFANGERATADWVDYHEPFNPRGDGYQETESSSSGPGAGEGSYSWLDVALGSDTGGSVRSPSGVQGLYGNRPSHGLVKLTNTMPLAPELDTAGLIARDPILWTLAATALYGDNINITSKYPSQILTIGLPESADNVPGGLVLDFLVNLTEFLNANVTAFNVATQWAFDNPSAAPIGELLDTTYALLISKEQKKLVRDPFYVDYAGAHNGRRPFVDPAPLFRWSYGDNSTATIEEAVANKTQFMDWFNSKVLSSDADTCSSSLLLYVGSDASTAYRNVYRNSPSVPFGFSSSSISVFSEAPDFVVPIGQASYMSTITQHAEYLPVTVDIMAAKGCDGMLFSLIEDLLAAGIVQVSKAGYSGIDGGDVLLKKV